MRKFWRVLSFAVACLVAAVAWELVSYEISRDEKSEGFQRRLWKEEAKVDELLRGTTPRNVSFTFPWKEKETVLLIYEKGKIAYWSNERIGTHALYQKLKSGGCFQKINNVYYDVRFKEEEGREYFALIMVREDYPTTNEYVRNHFNSALRISENNVAKMIVHDKDEAVGNLIRNRDGVPLFRLENTMTRMDYQPNHLILVLYLAFLFLLLYAYRIRLEQIRTCKRQLWSAVVFLGMLCLIRFLMMVYHLPGALYNLSVFQTTVVTGLYAVSVGDLFLSMFFAVHYLFVTLMGLRIKDVASQLVRFRYLFMPVLVLLVFFYANLLHFSVGSLIENTSISLNIARVVNINLTSFCLFFTLIIMGVGLIVLVNYTVEYFKLLFSFKRIMAGVTIVLVVCVWLSYVLSLSIPPLGCLFLLGFYYLFILNEYKVRRDAQKSVFMLAFVVVAVYVVFLAKSRESFREYATRARYASELILERDTIFERKLGGVQELILRHLRIDSLVERGEEEKAREALEGMLSEVTASRFACEVTLVKAGGSFRPDSVLNNPDEALLRKYGRLVDDTDFYHIERFDGEVTYMGRFVFPSASGAAVYYVRFENKREYDDLGYSRLLAYVLKEGGGYPYSYAKYVGGVLVASGGDYNYHRTTSRFGVYNHVQVVNREGYSHMIVPVGNDGTFIISLGNDVFRQYYLNIFYALFICMVLISYGMFFRFASPKEYRLKGSLQARIRNNVIYLIVGLAVLMTVLSVLFNTLSFEQRHRSRMIDLSRYVVSELEDFNTMDSNEDRRINQVLSNMYDISGVDVNIYDWHGRLVSTSRAFIFENGLDGFLLNPKAYQQIVREGNLRLVQYEEIGEIHYRSVYVPLELTNGKRYVVNIPYFTQSGELNMDILLIIVISVNIAVVVVVLAFALASIVAGRVTKPLQLVNDRLSQMKLGEKNEKISYDSQDEVGEVIKAYNNMVDKLSDSMKKLARSEREGAWMGMARQIAHEIKNPLTPMKLNLQFLQRAMRNDNPEELRRRVMNVSAVLIEQIDYMTSIASAFSDFSRLQVMNRELFNLSEQVDNCVRLFAENVDSLQSDVVPGVFVYGDKEQMNRVIVNVLKNAVQSIPEEREGRVGVRLYTEEGHVVLSIKDNGSGIPENIRDHVMEPNFTTKTKGTGLGLAMSYKIIENMGGTITFESKEGVGTIFYITLKYSEKD